MLRILPRIVPANWADDARRKRWPDVPLTVLTFALPLAGLIAIYSASIAVSYNETGDPHFYFRRQVLFLLVSFAAAVTMFRIDYHWYSRIQFFGISLTFWLLAAVVGVLVLMAVTDVGHVARGSERWIRWGPFSLQPSEIAKPILVLYLAQVFAKPAEGLNRLAQFAAPTLMIGLVAAIVALQPDLGTAIMILLIGAAVLVAARMPFLLLVGVTVLGLLAAWYAVLQEPYRLARLRAFLDPFNPQYQDNVSHHINQAFLAFGSGKITGVGLGRGLQKFFYLPEPHTDTIYAVIGEELGLLGTLAILLLFVLLAWRGFNVAARAPDLFGQLLAVGVTCGLFGQAILNMAVVTGLLPFTGIPLPFISAGGSSLLASAMAMGLLLNVSTQTISAPRKKKGRSWKMDANGNPKP